MKALSFRSLRLFHNVISEAEERALMQWVDPVMKRKRYEGNHWDDVISKYKEVDTANYRKSPEVQTILEQVQQFVKENMQVTHADSKTFISPHLIDLAPDGFIKSHVDSVKFSGDLVAGLSLGSTRAMILSRDAFANQLLFHDKALLQNEAIDASSLIVASVQVEQPNESEFPTKLTMVLPPRSLYIMQGIWRYQYGHAISLPVVDGAIVQSSKESAQSFQDPALRRISFIFRNILSVHDENRQC